MLDSPLVEKRLDVWWRWALESILPLLVNACWRALTLGSLASHVRCRAALCVPWPEPLDPVLGASLSTAYLTAEHGLEQLAQLKAGEFVLIHAAAGGVGQAAVQVAKRCGARILATASAAKQAALLEQGVEAVFDSRSTLFASQVLEHTAGHGVDVVLNSLKGEWVDASFQALAQGGCFVELGKLEIWSDQQVQERRPDVIYHRFDLLEVAARILSRCGNAFCAWLRKHSGNGRIAAHDGLSGGTLQRGLQANGPGRHVGKRSPCLSRHPLVAFGLMARIC